jgi:hypothetical protein
MIRTCKAPFIIDALDECVTDLPLFLKFIIKQSYSTSRVKWLVSSRNWPNIEKQLDLAYRKVRLSLELNENSISAAVSIYPSNKVDQLARIQSYDQKTRNTVSQYLSSNANDTFLWVPLVCPRLEDVPRGRVLVKLEAFLPGLDPLSQRMMEQIRDSDDANLCIQVLAIMSTVYRLITVTELTAFVEVLKDMSDNHESLSHIITLCGSFLTLR